MAKRSETRRLLEQNRAICKQRGIKMPTDEGKQPWLQIYFIQGVDGGPIKIGETYSVAKRLKMLQCGSPVKLRVIGVIDDKEGWTELGLHRKFAKYRLHGEWFEPAQELLEFIEREADHPKW